VDRLRTFRKCPNRLISGNFIGAPSAMIFRREANIFFDSRMKWLVDIDFYIKATRIGSFAFTQDFLININIEDKDRITNQCQKNLAVEFYEHQILYSNIRKTSAYFIFLIQFAKLLSKYRVRSVNYLKNTFPSLERSDFVRKNFLVIRFISLFYDSYNKIIRRKVITDL